MARTSLPSFLFVLALAGCPTSPGTDAAMPNDAMGPTGATCPPGDTKTWDTYGMAFFETYCTRCHSSTLSGLARMGAPAGLNWDVHSSVMLNRDRIDRVAAGGPMAVNRYMPFSGTPIPTDAERIELGEYLACGAP